MFYRIVQRSSDERYAVARGFWWFSEYIDLNGHDRKTFDCRRIYWWERDKCYVDWFRSYDDAMEVINRLNDVPPKTTYKVVYPNWMTKLIFWK